MTVIFAGQAALVPAAEQKREEGKDDPTQMTAFLCVRFNFCKCISA